MCHVTGTTWCQHVGDGEVTATESRPVQFGSYQFSLHGVNCTCSKQSSQIQNI